MKAREELESTTEAEAIELIQSQVAELEALRCELRQKNEQVASLSSQVQQAQSYKEQIATLRRQVQICEENSIKNEQIVEKAKFASSIEKELQAEIQDLEERLGASLEKSEEKNEKVSEMERKLANKEKKNKEIRREIERMGERVVCLQNSQKVKDEENIKKFQKFESQMKEMLNDKRRSHEKARTLTKQLEAMNIQIEKAALKEKEQNELSRRLQRELKQVRDENMKLHSLLEQLSMENSSVNALRSKANQLDNFVASLTEQFELERRRFEEMNNEKERIESELRELQIKHLGPGRGANSIEGLKAVIDQLESQLEESRNRNRELNEGLREQEARTLNLENEEREIHKYLSSSIGSLQIWIESQLSNYHLEEQREGEQPRTTKQAPKQKLAKYEDLIEKLRGSLKEGRRQGLARFREMRLQLERMKQELWETNELKDEIVSDLGGFKSSIREQESHLNGMRDENQRMREECHTREEEVIRQKRLRAQEAASNRALLVDFCHALNCVREKFISVEYVRRQLSLKVEANAEESPTAAVSELIALVGDITNLQSFEIKSLQLRMMELDESKQGWEQNKAELYTELERLEKLKQEEVKKLEDAYSAKYAQFTNISSDLERTIKDLTDELEHSRVKMLHSTQDRQLLEERAQSAEEETHRLNKVKIVMVQIALGLVLRVEELVEEKRALSKMVESGLERESFFKQELETMFQKYKIDETLGSLKKKQLTHKGAKVIRALRFRKCVIAVIATFRFRNARHFGLNIRSISENLQCLRNQADGRLDEEFSEMSSENYDSLNIDLRGSCSSLGGPPPHATLAMRNVFRRMHLLTVPGFKRIEPSSLDPKEDSRERQELEYLWKHISEFVQELRLQQASHQMAQKKIDPSSGMLSPLIPQHQSLLSVFGQSSLLLKHHAVESEVDGGDLRDVRLKWVEQAFCGKKGFTGNLEKVGKFLEKIDRQSQEIFKTFKNIEKERGVLHERTGRLVLENKGVLHELHRAKEELESLRADRRDMVQGETFSQLEEQYEEKIRENEGLSRRIDSLQDKERELQSQLSGLLREKKDLHQEKMVLEAKHRQLERQMEVKEAEMGSVQQMLESKENEMQGVQLNSQSMSFEKQGLVQKMSELEHERQKLIKDNVFLISQNELFSKKIEELKIQESKVEANGQAQMREYVELVQFYNAKATKFEQITQLQETNMKVGLSHSGT